MADTSALEAGTVIAERYRVVEKIGHGGMGAVYVVEHIHTEEKLAMKVLHPQVLRDASAVERFRREARAPARITSEHVARVTDADTAADLDGAPFYVMELLRGRDLERILREDGPIPPAQVVEYLRQAARALDKAHAIGIVHRDLKPENLFLTEREDGTPCIKLLDFGIARIGEAGTTQPDGKISTQVGYVMGTPNYMAPEQTMGNPELVGAATDVWALGLLAFKLLVGHEFFAGTTTAALYAEILVSPVPTPTDRGSKLGPAFDEWFAGCVARPVEQRFSSAGLAVARLAEAFSIVLPARTSTESFPDLRVAGPPPPPPSPPPAGPAEIEPAGAAIAAPKRPGRIVPIAIGAALALAALIGSVVVLNRTPAEGLVSTPASATAMSASSVASEAPPEPSSSAAVPVALESARPRPTPTGAAASTSKPASTGGHKEPATVDHALSVTQKRRLDALQRLCSQGTYTAAECAAKRQAILHGP